MEIQDLTTKLYYPELRSRDGLPVYSVGWLGHLVPRTGDVNEEVLRRLHHFAVTNPQEKVFGLKFGAWGSHTCEICGEHENHGEIIVTTSRAHYMLPRMVFHYIESHHYRPPDQFLEELLAAKIERVAPEVLPFPVRDSESLPSESDR